MSSNKKIVAISGSLRAGSSNHAILRYLGSLMPEGVDYIIYDGLAQLPHFDPGLDNETPPLPVVELRQLLNNADCVIICSPEYAFGVPGSLKNLLDWTVGSGSLEGKPLALITASTGGQHAHAALQLILGNALGAKISEETSLLISFIRTKVDAGGNITDAETKRQLSACLENFQSRFDSTDQ
jgi:chromate reductase